MKAAPKIQEFFDRIAGDMMLTLGISHAEAVARINWHWGGYEFPEDDIILHEQAHYWAMRIYYPDVLDWSPDADRSHWGFREKPPADSGCWTLGIT